MDIDKKPRRMADTVNEFCAYARIGRSKFYEELRNGRIRVVKIGKKTLVPISERDAYLQRLEGGAR